MGNYTTLIREACLGGKILKKSKEVITLEIMSTWNRGRKQYREGPEKRSELLLMFLNLSSAYKNVYFRKKNQ